jgi:hypothetical protein
MVHLELVLISTHYRCMVCTERTIGSVIILYALDDTPWMMWVKWKLVAVRFKIVLILAQDRCTFCAKCTTGMEIVLGTTNGSPR